MTYKRVCTSCWWDFSLLPFRWLVDRGTYCKTCQDLKIGVARDMVMQETADRIIEDRRERAFADGCRW